MRKNGSTWRAGTRLGMAAVAVGALVIASGTGASAAPAAPQSPRTGPVVSTGDGMLRGKTVGATDEFLGIPRSPLRRSAWPARQKTAFT